MTLTNDEVRTLLLREHQLIFDRAQIGILVLRDHVIQRCNPRFEEMLGYGPGELVGKSTRIFYFSDEAWQETGRRVYSAVAEAGSFDGEDIYRRRDGTRIWVRVTGVFINPGHPEGGFLGLYDDVTEQRQAADALKALLREHQLVVERARIGIVVLRDRVIQRCNPRFEEMLGYGPGELVGKSTRVCYPISDEEWNALGRRAYAAIAETGSFVGESRYQRRDGSLIWVRLTGSLLNRDNPDEGYVWLYEDISDRRATEQALLQSNQEQKLIFDNALVGISYHRNRVIQRCNPRFEEIFGYGPGELVGKSTRAYYSSDEEWEQMGLRVLEADAREHSFEGELCFRKRDGTPIWVHALGRTVDTPEGLTWIWAYEDITRRHRAEEALRQSFGEMERRVAERTAEVSRQLNFMEQLIEAIPGPVFYKDRQGRYLGFNQRYLDFIGKPRSEMIGATVYDIAPRDLADRYQAADEELFSNPGLQVYETQVQPVAGERRDVLFHKATFANPDGGVGGIIGIMLDITERKRMEARMQQAATVFDSSAEGIIITAPDGSIIAVNRAFTEITGYGESEVLGRNPRILQSGRQDPDFYREMWQAIDRDGRWQGELWNKRKDGSLVPEWLTVSAVKDAAGKVMHYVGVAADISEIKRATDLLDHQAHHDYLTGLPNRLLLEDRLRGALLRAQRDESQVAVLFLDLDRFKNINDSLGHHVGDRVLCDVAQRFSALMRESDTVARMGGDEFLVVLEGIHEAAVAARVADKILDDLRANPVALEQEFFVGASIGISLFPQDGADSVTLIKHADAAMYRAKESGRNTYEFFSDDLTQFSLDRFRMETDLRRAMERDELRVYLQPQFSLKTGKLLGAEALVRWQHPQQGLVAPEKFISLAEESGLIVTLGEWVQRTACGHWAEWVRAGLNPGVLSINVSGVEFRRGQIEGTVRKVLDATGLPPELLEMEITEGAIMSHAEQSIRVLHGLRAMGISLAVDDFGTGYSSLAYLKRLPLNKLKIDQGFVLGLPGDAEDCAIVRAVIALAHSLQLKVIAEGVETEQQLEFLTREACDEMQGYLRGNPMPVDEFRRDFLKS